MTAELTGQQTSRPALLGRGDPLFPSEPRTLAELFQAAAERYDRADALNYKKDGHWSPISSRQIITRAKAMKSP